MANDLAGSAERQLAALALGEGFNLCDALKLADGLSVPSVIATYQDGLVPLGVRDPKLTGSDSTQLENRLRPIGAKIAAHLSPEQANAWRKAMVLALSDMPPRVAVQAAREAIHVPMKFLSEVESTVRDKAKAISERHARALARLRMLQREIEQAAMPKLEAPPDKPMTIEDARCLLIGHPQGFMLLHVGLSSGAITQQDHDTIKAEMEAERENG